jgi:endonuclease YncB( thermonuclease family)
MKKFFLAAMISVSMMSSATANPYPVKVLRVIDGDTIEIEARFLPPELKQKLSIRVLGVDTPEKGHRAQCPQEAALAERASAYTKSLIASGQPVEIDIVGWDKYGGRILGAVRVGGQDLTQGLIANGLARPYHGEKKSSWCQ